MTSDEKRRLEEEFNKKYAKYIKHLEEETFLRNKKNQIKKLKKDNRKSLGITTTKILSYYLFILCNIILVYAMVAMWHFADLTYLGVIITDIVGQIFIFGIYSIKSYKETKSEETIRLERDKLNALPDTARNKINQIFDMMESLGLTKDNIEEVSPEPTPTESAEAAPYLEISDLNNEINTNKEGN